MPNMYHAFDGNLEHRAAGSAALTATTVLDTLDERVAQRTVFRTIFNVESIDVSSGDESYKLVVELSDDNFATINEVAAILDIGATGVRQSGVADSAAGDRYEVMWASASNNRAYRYARLKLFISGTSPSIAAGCFSAILGDV